MVFKCNETSAVSDEESYGKEASIAFTYKFQ
jgi:hypothetical protein